jgi:hypothetical protein
VLTLEYNKVSFTIELDNQVSITLIIDINEDMGNEEIEKEAEKILIDKFGSNLLDQVDGYEIHPYED